MIQSGDFTGAFSLLNSLASTEDAASKQRIHALIGDAEKKRGRFEKALQIYQSVEGNIGDHRRDWVRPFFGKLVALLKLARISDAMQLARNAAEKAEALEQAFRQQLTQLRSNLSSGQSVAIVKRPVRASVVITRIGHLFLQEGEFAFAQEMFQRAIGGNPKGGCRARLGIAEIALRSGENDTAVKWASDAIIRGKFQAKTLSGWPILIAANCRQGVSGVDSTMLDALAKMPPTVRSRASLLIVQNLRKFGDPSWRSLAEQWSRQSAASDPIATAELRKLILSSAKRKAGGTNKEIAALANSLLEVSKLAFHEWKSAIKEIIGASYAEKSKPDLESLIGAGITRFGADAAPQVIHGVALACISAGDQETGSALLSRALAVAKPDTEEWGKITWALAKCKTVEGDHMAAAGYYQAFNNSINMPVQLRMFALVEWVRCLTRANKPFNVSATIPQLWAALDQINDYNILLDVARQLGRAAVDDPSIAEAYRAKGERLALEAINTGAHPSHAVTALFKLARRQNDFGEFSGTIQLWESLSQQRRDWLWTTKSEFWEFVSLVIMAYGLEGRLDEAEKVALAYVDDAATPISEWVRLHAVLAIQFVRLKRTRDAIAIFSEIITADPQHEMCSYAYYWLAIESLSRGDEETARHYAHRIRLCLSDSARLGWQRRLLDLASIISKGLEVADKSNSLTLLVYRDMQRLL